MHPRRNRSIHRVTRLAALTTVAHRAPADASDVVKSLPDLLRGVLENFMAGDRGNTVSDVEWLESLRVFGRLPSLA